MPTRNVVLTEHQSQLIEHLVTTGRYQNASEVLRDGLRLVEQRAAEDEARLKALDEGREPQASAPTVMSMPVAANAAAPAPRIESGTEFGNYLGTWRFLYRSRA